MAKSRNPVRFPAPHQLGLPVGSDDATDLDLARNVEHFATYFTYRRAGKRPASLETLAKDRTQWNALCKWFATERVRAEDATEASFKAFFALPERVNNSIRNKKSYLRLFDRVMYCVALAEQQGGTLAAALPSPFGDEDDGGVVVAPVAVAEGRLQWNRAAARLAETDQYRMADSRCNNRPAVFLSETDDRLLRNFLFNLPQEGQLADLRTHVLMAVIRGSGASPGEIRTLQLDEIDCDAQGRPLRLRMYGRSGSAGHVYELEDYALRALNYWLAFNRSPNVEGGPERGFPVVQHVSEAKQVRYVFPNLYHRGERYGQAIDADTATRAVRERLHKLGIRAEGSITQMLRTQFATSALREGQTPQEVVERMGYYDVRSVLGFVEIAHGTHGAGARF